MQSQTFPLTAKQGGKGKQQQKPTHQWTENEKTKAEPISKWAARLAWMCGLEPSMHVLLYQMEILLCHAEVKVRLCEV